MDSRLCLLPLALLFRSRCRWAAGLLVVLFCASSAFATPPTAPTNLRCNVTGSNSVTLIWDDNSTDETGFEIAYTLNGGALSTLPLGSSSGTSTIGTSLSPLTSGLPDTFKIRAVKGSETSAYSNTCNVNIGALNPPTDITSSVKADGSVRLLWTDNAYAEAGYFLEYRVVGATAYTVAGAVATDVNDLTISRMSWMVPGTSYQFRVRAFQGTSASPTTYSAYSSAVTAAIPALSAPTNLAVTATNETSIHFSIQGTTGNNTGYEFERSPAGQNTFTVLGTLADSTSSPYLFTTDAADIADPGTAYDFRVCAYFQNADGSLTYSGYSNLASVTTPFYPPTNLVATPSATSPYQISFTWSDNSNAETGYSLEYRKQNPANPEAFAPLIATIANVTSINNVPEFEPGTIYEFRLRAYGNGSNVSAYYPATGGIAATTKDGFTSKPYAPITLGSPFSYQLSTQGQSACTSWTAGSLPAGLSFDGMNGVISGTPSIPGVYTVPITAYFANGTSHPMSLVLRVIRPPAPPQIDIVIPAQTLAQSGSTTLALGSNFSDPDTESAVRMSTSSGDLDLVLYSQSTPQTVANFLGYANRGDYASTIFHRKEAGFVLQGGGYFYYSAPNIFTHLSTVASVVNEPGISNLVGTLAMAKTDRDPNSATSEFFFNLGDNSANLDSQNDGFTVFGRVATPSLTGALTTLATMQITNYNVQFYNSNTQALTSGSFGFLPVDGGGSIPSVTSVTALPILTYSVISAPDSSVATVTLNGSSLQINAVASGTTSVTVGATDVDGNTTPQTFSITVQETLAQWAAAQGYTGVQTGSIADPNSNGLTNLHEFAFMGNPVSGTRAQLPTLAMKPVGQDRYAEITFPVRKFTTGLTYAVEASSTLAANDWTPLWTSAAGFSAPAVSNVQDQTDRTLVTVRDTQAATSTARRFLRVKLIGP